jgi:hypothetical protein
VKLDINIGTVGSHGFEDNFFKNPRRAQALIYISDNQSFRLTKPLSTTMGKGAGGSLTVDGTGEGTNAARECLAVPASKRKSSGKDSLAR